MKKIAIMQPYFFPYLGYFSLIKHTDEFILFDSVQFIRHGWIERNRVLKQGEGWLYIKAPLGAHGRDTLIQDLKVDNTKPWKDMIKAQLQFYKKVAPYYAAVMEMMGSVFARDYDTIVGLDKAALEAVCGYLDINKKFKVFSDMHLAIDSVQAPDEWALNICKALGDVSEYWNPPGGQEFFDKSKYDAAGIELKFLQAHLKPYDQKREPFEAGLSIIDVLMFNSPAQVNEMLDDYELV